MRSRSLGAVHGQVGALRHVLAKQAVGVLVRAPLPGAVRVAEVDLDAGVDREARRGSDISLPWSQVIVRTQLVGQLR